MPKLNKTQAKKVDEQESTGFGPLDAGWYTGRLAKVEAKNSSNNNPMWVWEFDELETLDGDSTPGRQWVNTVLLDQSFWVLKMMFDAFGYSTDSDTDEMVGERVKLLVSQRMIEQGNRKGQMGNNVDQVAALDDAGAGTEKETAEVF